MTKIAVSLRSVFLIIDFMRKHSTLIINFLEWAEYLNFRQFSHFTILVISTNSLAITLKRISPKFRMEGVQ